jgi:hypothetical protein
VDVLAEYGPTLGRPLVDTLVGSKLANLKELRPGQTNIRVLFVFDPWRSAILLVAGDKTRQWHKWYEVAIPQAEQLFALYLKERAKVEEEGRDQLLEVGPRRLPCPCRRGGGRPPSRCDHG